jgi:tetratricopeptide (TPR) repeat protein
VPLASGIVLSLLLTLGTQPAEGPSAKALDDLDHQAAEFPPFDFFAQRLYVHGMTEKLASERLARAPDSVETLEILLEANRINDALTVLHRIVTKHPDRIPPALEVVARTGYPFLPDEGRGYNDRLQQIFTIARKRLPDLPREEAAWAARHMLAGDLEAVNVGGWRSALKIFAEEYAGTEAASLGDTIVFRPRDRGVVARTVLDPTALTYEAALRHTEKTADGSIEPQSFAKARDLLVAASTDGQGLYRRKALATLASQYFYQRDYPNARDHYTKYLETYPRSPWAWVAALRVGQCAEQLGDWHRAAAAYRAAFTTYRNVPPARVLGHAYSARAWEALGRLDDARRELERALADWDRDYGHAYSIRAAQRPDPSLRINESMVRDPWEVTNAAIPGRIAQLKRWARLPEGALLERGRWLLEQNQRRDAWVTLEDLIAKHPRSTAVPEARDLAHRAHVEEALGLASEESSTRDLAAALTHLDLVAGDGYDFGVCAAKIAKATVLWKRGAAVEAETLMGRALEEWHAHQAPLRLRQQSSPLAKDVAQIRTLLFRPTGGGVFGVRSWNAMDWPAQPPPFVIVNRDVSVTLANGDVLRLPVYQNVSAGKVLFMAAEHVTFLDIDALGGTAKAERARRDILTFWNRFFPARPGHWGGWVVYTYPILNWIEFLDSARSKALAPAVVGRSGATVVLEKTGGGWTAKRLTHQWIE